jgi:hypothetical protein
MLRYGLLGLALVCMSLPATAGPAAPFPAPKTLGTVDKYGANIQRSMALMASSTGLSRNTVRVLFYGQSITAAAWTRLVAERMRRTYPLVDFIFENRAIAAFSSELLEKTAEADLYPFYPDLVIFHNYGSPACFENIIRRTRERTTADILIATDHVAPSLGDKMDEETDPGRLLPPKPGEECYGPWRNRVFLPGVARKYRAELADVRTVWKQYLRDHKLSPSDLLIDGLHPNAHGNFLMAEIIFAHLRLRPDLGRRDDERVKTYTIGPEGDLQWKDGKLRMPFVGNKIDLICKEGSAAPAPIRIDGKRPSEFQELYVPSRVVMDSPRGPAITVLRLGSEQPRIVENWQMKLTGDAEGGRSFRFRVIGSVTGDDGEGQTGKRFVSKSGRVVIEPDDFYPEFALRTSRDQKAASIECSWKVEPLFADEFAAPAAKNPFGETVVIAAQGLANGNHTLEITGSPETPIAAIRIYRPGRQ